MMNVSAVLNEIINCKDLVKIQNFVNGNFMDSRSDEWIDSHNPATGNVWAQVPDSDVDEVNEAVEHAYHAFPNWSSTSAKYRSDLLLKLAEIIEHNLEAFAIIESRDQGKPVKLATNVDIPRCVQNFRFFATTILHNTDMCREQHDPCHALNYVHRSAVGVAGLISPWNLPLYLLSFKLAPALACGNTVVVKPSEFTSVTAWLLAHAIKQAGFPDGVVNMVFGRGGTAGAALVNHPLVPLISFTGSTITGNHIAQKAAVLNKKLSLEMGGKNACIVFSDVQLDESLPTIIKSCFANQGEICLCSSRLFVQKTIFDDFVTKFVELANKLKVGDPTAADTDLGPLVSAQHLQKVQYFYNLANKTDGVEIVCGKRNLNLQESLKNGYYFCPTVVIGASDLSAPMQEEIFGPLVCISPFDNEAEVIQRANNVDYGLSASVWSNNVNTVHRVAQKLNVGGIHFVCSCFNK